jgi:hypothetical protein
MQNQVMLKMGHAVNSNESSHEVGTVIHGKLSHVVSTENQRESSHVKDGSRSKL